MNISQISPAGEVQGRTNARWSRKHTARAVTTFLLAAVFALTGTSAAIAAPGCDKPGVCPCSPPTTCTW
jgi:hypothetical protein